MKTCSGCGIEFDDYGYTKQRLCPVCQYEQIVDRGRKPRYAVVRGVMGIPMVAEFADSTRMVCAYGLFKGRELDPYKYEVLRYLDDGDEVEAAGRVVCRVVSGVLEIPKPT